MAEVMGIIVVTCAGGLTPKGLKAELRTPADGAFVPLHSALALNVSLSRRTPLHRRAITWGHPAMVRRLRQQKSVVFL